MQNTSFIGRSVCLSPLAANYYKAWHVADFVVLSYSVVVVRPEDACTVMRFFR